MTTILDFGLEFASEGDRDLNSLITLYLLTRREARPDDDLQDPTDRGGWWGDAYPDTEGYKVGSRLWTLTGRGLPTALALAPDMVTEALQPLVDLGVLSGVEVQAERVGPGVMGLLVRPVLPTGEIVDTLDTWYISV